VAAGAASTPSEDVLHFAHSNALYQEVYDAIASVSAGLLAAFTAFCVAQQPSILAQNSDAPQRTLIRAGHLLDVHTGKLLDAQAIIVC
jgi:hypothetical protein